MAYKYKEDQARCAALHYQRNKQTIKAKVAILNRLIRARNRKFVTDYLNEHPCVDCGQSDIVVLEFDHVRGIKCDNVSTGANESWSLRKLQTEINKCEIRCANCHRRVTDARRHLKKGTPDLFDEQPAQKKIIALTLF